MSKEYQAKQAALVADHIAKQDIVITTALIPGRPAPRLVSKEMVASMRPGSVLVDLAVERGGNVEGAVAGQIADVNGVRIVGHLNVSGRIAASASQLYARNLIAFVETLVDKEAKVLKIDPEEELVKATLLTHQGKILHPAFAKAETAAAPAAVEKAAAKGCAEIESRETDGKGSCTQGDCKAREKVPAKAAKTPSSPKLQLMEERHNGRYKSRQSP